jgi:hypothetical protein
MKHLCVLNQLLDAERGFFAKPFGISRFLPHLSEKDLVVFQELDGTLLRRLFIPMIPPSATAVKSPVFPRVARHETLSGQPLSGFFDSFEAFEQVCHRYALKMQLAVKGVFHAVPQIVQ